MNRRFYCPDLQSTNKLLTLPDGESHHLRTVLRGKHDEQIYLLDGKGTIVRARILLDGRKRGPVQVAVAERHQYPEPQLSITLCVAPPRPKQMSLLLRGVTELGVKAIQPISTQYSQGKIALKAYESWQQDCLEACKQSGNPWLPEIRQSLPMDQAIQDMQPPAIVGCPPEAITDQIECPWPESGPVSLWIGPEGGFSPEEQQSLLDWGATPASYAPYILRVETAAVAGVTLLQQRGGKA